jgi:hypothetical protein
MPMLLCAPYIGHRPSCRGIDVLGSAALDIQYDRLRAGAPVPSGEEPGVPITVNGDPTESEIGVAGEVDVFRFGVRAFSTYTIETGGHTDTFLTLFFYLKSIKWRFAVF